MAKTIFQLEPEDFNPPVDPIGLQKLKTAQRLMIGPMVLIFFGLGIQLFYMFSDVQSPEAMDVLRLVVFSVALVSAVVVTIIQARRRKALGVTMLDIREACRR